MGTDLQRLFFESGIRRDKATIMLEMDVKLNLDQFNLSATLALDSPMTALFGPKGSGKSTLLGMLAGTVHPQRGWIKLGGETLFDSGKKIRVPAGRRGIGLVGQEPTAQLQRSVKGHLREAQGRARVRGDGGRFDAIIHLLELEPLLDRHSRQLSTGEKRRVAVAHALMSSPRLLLVDGQSNAPDDDPNSRILPFLPRVRESLKIPVIYVSQTLGDILQLTDQMVLMADGRILGAGNVHDIVADRILLASAGLRGIENTIPVTIVGHETEHGCTIARHYGTELVLPLAPHLGKGQVTEVSIRSNNIALSKQHLQGISIQNQIRGRICAIIRTQEHAVVQIDCGSILLAGVSLKALHEMDLQEGEGIYCLIKAHALSYVKVIDRTLPNRIVNSGCWFGVSANDDGASQTLTPNISPTQN